MWTGNSMSPWCFGQVHLETNKFNHKFHSTAANKSNANKTFTTPLTQDQGPRSHAAFTPFRSVTSVIFCAIKREGWSVICHRKRWWWDTFVIDRLVIAWEMGQRGDREREQTKGERANSSYLIISRLFYRKSFVKSWLSASLSHNGSRPVLWTRRGETVNSDTARRRKMGSA
jgi:hypothetical protein